MPLGGSMLISTIVPLLVAPAVTWYVVDLLLKVNLLEETMREFATYDSLTGLLNRRAFMEYTDQLFSIAKRHEQIFSILMVDLDEFKKINDQYGHDVGDKVLASFGKLLMSTTRESDLVGRIDKKEEESHLVGRMGGDEFIIFLPNTSESQAWIFSERLHHAVRKDGIKWKGVSIQYTISMGLISYPKTMTQDLDELLPQADKALYVAKANGRNQTAIFSDQSQE